ncbi:MAG: arylesterase [Verrucomicrobiota bacterium]|nr:arylesterase [Verrucomicrobiota bacterium]
MRSPLLNLFLLCVFSSLLFTAYAQGQQRILIIGDSIAAGYGIDSEAAFPALLQKKIDAENLNFQVVNAGVSGDTTAGGLRRIDWLLRQPAEVIVIELGGNDGLRGIPPSETKANLAGMIQKIREKSPRTRIVLAGMQMPPNMGEKYVTEFAALYPALSTEYKTELIPFVLEGVGGKPDLNQEDRIHPTEKGHQIIAETVWKTLGPILRKS